MENKELSIPCVNVYALVNSHVSTLVLVWVRRGCGGGGDRDGGKRRGCVRVRVSREPEEALAETMDTCISAGTVESNTTSRLRATVCPHTLTLPRENAD